MSTKLGLVFGGLLSLSVSAQAERYLVHFESSQAFSAANQALREAVRLGVRSRDAFGGTTLERPRLLGTEARLADSLANLDMVIVDGDEASAELLRQRPEVSFVEKETFFPAPRMPTGPATTALAPAKPADSEITWGLKAVKAPEAWEAVTSSGSQGEGVRVLIIDTGIDRDHADLKDNFEKGQNFITSRNPMMPANAVASLFDVSVFTDPQVAPNASYDYFDQVGHGSHVAGTIAGVANGFGVVGVAPKAKILAGRVCGKLGCSSTAIVAAINWAITEKVDVINMSLGGPSGSKSQELALKQVEAANVVTVAASGNDGAATVSFPAAYSTVLAVGAIDSKLEKAAFSNWGPELGVMAPGVEIISSVPTGSGRNSKVVLSLSGVQSELNSSSFSGSAETEVTGVLALAGLGKPDDFKNADVKGKIALIQRGEIPFAEKVKNALAAGATAVLVYNNAPGLISGAITQDGSVISIPVAMIEQAAGEDLKAKISAAPAIASATLSTTKTDYASFQGTSMASPHVAGVAALVRGANKSLNAVQVKDLLRSTATARLPATPDNQYGKGYVNALAAVQAAQH